MATISFGTFSPVVSRANPFPRKGAGTRDYTSMGAAIDYRVEGKGWETPVFLRTHPRFAGTKIYRVNTYLYLLALYLLKEVFLVFAYTCQNGSSFKPLSTINSDVNEVNCRLEC